jgi:hypothetical protein
MDKYVTLMTQISTFRASITSAWILFISLVDKETASRSIIVIDNLLIRETNKKNDKIDGILDSYSVKYYGEKHKCPYKTQDRTSLFLEGKCIQPQIYSLLPSQLLIRITLHLKYYVNSSLQQHHSLSKNQFNEICTGTYTKRHIDPN